MPQIKILLFLWNNKGKIALAVVLCLLVWYIWLADKRGDERDALKDQVAGYQQVVADMKEWHEATTAALERKSGNDKERNDYRNGEAVRNQKDRASGDGPLAPVLRNGLRSLRERQGTGKSGS